MKKQLIPLFVLMAISAIAGVVQSGWTTTGDHAAACVALGANPNQNGTVTNQSFYGPLSVNRATVFQVMALRFLDPDTTHGWELGVNGAETDLKISDNTSGVAPIVLTHGSADGITTNLTTFNGNVAFTGTVTGIPTGATVTGTPGAQLVFDGTGTGIATNALHYFPGYFTNGQTWFLTIGDSIGIGGNGCTLTNNPQSRFFSKWAPTNFIYADNKGVVGQTAATTLANYSADTSAWKPIGGTNSIIMDQSGINDIHGGVTASNLFLTTSNICRLAHADGFKIIVNQLYPYANISGAELANLTDYNQMLEKVPGMWDYLFAVNYVLPAPPNEDCYSDHIHPNQRGNESIARELDALLRCGLYNKWPKQPCPSSAPSGVVRGPADRGESESWFMQGATGTGYRMLITGDAGSFSGQHMDFDGVVYNYAHNGSGSIAGADIFETATPSTSILSVANSWTLSLTGDFRPTKTITAGGTTGAQVINKTSGSVNFAAAATTLTVADSLVTTSSVIICTIASNDTTAKSACVVAASGTFTITLNAAATAETRVNFFVTN